MYMSVLPACASYVHGACGGQKRVSNPLELELQMVRSYHVDAGIQTWFPAGATNALNC